MADIQRQIAANAEARTVQASIGRQHPRSPRSGSGRGAGGGGRHGCPGGCGLTVPRHQLACPACWQRLPGPMRHRVSTAYAAHRRSPTDEARAAEHRQAMTTAIAWYRDQSRHAKRAGS